MLMRVSVGIHLDDLDAVLEHDCLKVLYHATLFNAEPPKCPLASLCPCKTIVLIHTH
jgi:hypothetical protein